MHTHFIAIGLVILALGWIGDETLPIYSAWQTILGSWTMAFGAVLTCIGAVLFAWSSLP